MTSILAFKINKGKQMIIVGDTQHTFENTTSEEEKIFFFGDFLYCGSGFDSIIKSILAEVNEITDLKSCAEKIKCLIKEKHEAYGKTGLGGISSGDVAETEILLLNFKTLKGYYIRGLEKQDIEYVTVLGRAGPAKEGEIINEYREDFETTLKVKESLFKKIFETFHYLGKNLPSTGHPALFKLEGYILEKGKSPTKFNIKFTGDISDYSKYEIE